MNTIDSMCEVPSLMGKTSSTTIANPIHPSPSPSLGSTGSLGSAPPEGGVCKHPGELVDPELGGLLVGKGWHPLGLRPLNLKSWKLGCGYNLPPTKITTIMPYRPTPPPKTALQKSILRPTPTIVTSIATNHIRTATGGRKVVPRKPTKTFVNGYTYVCEGMDCSFGTNSPYKFANHLSTPHIWKPGSQNWCFAKAKSLAQGNMPSGMQDFIL